MSFTDGSLSVSTSATAKRILIVVLHRFSYTCLLIKNYFLIPPGESLVVNVNIIRVCFNFTIILYLVHQLHRTVFF